MDWKWYDPILLFIAIVIGIWLNYRWTGNSLQTKERRSGKDRRKRQRRWIVK